MQSVDVHNLCDSKKGIIEVGKPSENGPFSLNGPRDRNRPVQNDAVGYVPQSMAVGVTLPTLSESYTDNHPPGGRKDKNNIAFPNANQNNKQPV